MSTLTVRVPELGGFAQVDVLEVLVAAGATVAAEESLITLESDKASMDVPSPAAGVVRTVHVKAGDKVSEGTAILELEVVAGAHSQPSADPKTSPTKALSTSPQKSSSSAPAPAATPRPFVPRIWARA